MRLVPLLLLAACGGEFRFTVPAVVDVREVVPGDGMPTDDLTIQDANNICVLENGQVEATMSGGWPLAAAMVCIVVPVSMLGLGRFSRSVSVCSNCMNTRFQIST